MLHPESVYSADKDLSVGILQVITRDHCVFVIWNFGSLVVQKILQVITSCNDHVIMSWDFAASAGAAIAMTREVEGEIAEVILVKQ